MPSLEFQIKSLTDQVKIDGFQGIIVYASKITEPEVSATSQMFPEILGTFALCPLKLL